MTKQECNGCQKMFDSGDGWEDEYGNFECDSCWDDRYANARLSFGDLPDSWYLLEGVSA